MKKNKFLIFLLAASLICAAGCGNKNDDENMELGEIVIEESTEQESDTTSSEITEIRPFRLEPEITVSHMKFHLNNIGNNIYYQEATLKSVPEDKKEDAVNALNELSKLVSEKDPNLTLLITGLAYSDDKLSVYGNQYFRGVNIQDVSFLVNISGTNIDQSGIDFSKFIDFETLRGVQLLEVQDYYGKVKRLLLDHIYDIDPNNTISKADVEAETLLTNNTYIFRFTTVNGSYIIIDAKTGQILEEVYSDGAHA